MMCGCSCSGCSCRLSMSKFWLWLLSYPLPDDDGVEEYGYMPLSCNTGEVHVVGKALFAVGEAVVALLGV